MSELLPAIFVQFRRSGESATTGWAMSFNPDTQIVEVTTVTDGCLMTEYVHRSLLLGEDRLRLAGRPEVARPR